MTINMTIKKKIFKLLEIKKYITEFKTYTNEKIPSWVELWDNGYNSYSVFDCVNGCVFQIGYLKTNKKLF